ncbi:MAG: hypothetical protein KAJ19_20690 [Gammaproteobacteria bacterium]|nr:hypothetical protein [Gammaproteobacteria bacterium]
MPRRAVEVENRVCKNCDVELDEGGDYCSSDCELQSLRKQVAKHGRKKGPIQCLGRVDWATCYQEWYLKDSYDAKRRANQLRKLGYGCSAQSIGEMPVDTGDGVPMVKVTILTIWRTHEGHALPPPPESFIDGIRTNGRTKR